MVTRISSFIIIFILVNFIAKPKTWYIFSSKIMSQRFHIQFYLCLGRFWQCLQFFCIEAFSKCAHVCLKIDDHAFFSHLIRLKYIANLFCSYALCIFMVFEYLNSELLEKYHKDINELQRRIDDTTKLVIIIEITPYTAL